jgi:hypothetical protein
MNLRSYKEFEGLSVFLGIKINYKSYKKAKQYAQSLKLKNGNAWLKHTKSKNFPNDIRVALSGYKEFKGIEEFLGTKINYKSYKDAEKYAKSLKLNTIRDWYNLARTKEFPKDIPAAVSDFYKNKGFKSWSNFLGNSRVLRAYKEAKKYAQSLKLNSALDWRILSKNKKLPKDIPSKPDRDYYEWEHWGEFLGTGSKPRSKKS